MGCGPQTFLGAEKKWNKNKQTKTHRNKDPICLKETCFFWLKMEPKDLNSEVHDPTSGAQKAIPPSPPVAAYSMKLWPSLTRDPYNG